MDTVSRILWINLAVLMVPALIIFFMSLAESGQYAGMGYGLFMMVYPGFLCLVFLGLALVYHLRRQDPEPLRSDRKKGQLISAGLVLLIGTSLCFGGMFLMDAVN